MHQLPYINQYTTNTYDPLKYSFLRRRPLRCTSLHHSIILNSQEDSLEVSESASNNMIDSLQEYQSTVYQPQDLQKEMIQYKNEINSSETMDNMQRNLMYFVNPPTTNLSQMDFSQEQDNCVGLSTLSCAQSNTIKQISEKNKLLTPKPKMIQRIVASLLEESAPAESEIKNEALLSEILHKSRYVNKYIGSYNSMKEKKSKDIMNDSPVMIPVEKEINCFKETKTTPFSRKPLYTYQQKSDIDLKTKNDLMFSPIKDSIQIGDTCKRKVHSDERFEPYPSFKRRAVSPQIGNISPTLMIGTFSAKQNIFPIQDTNDGLMKMSLQ
ncbi:hypothetical protein PCANB_002267 [Pneumocystis canis]|nr:hypothetical protein PCK1_002323 [Pneumocystis canis]KAG5438937.1 hypothetical protein PCANB_002267 [Pneumocystis canis]